MFQQSFRFSLYLSNELIIHAQSITNYLNNCGGAFIFMEQRKLNLIKPKTKKKLIEKLVFYTFETYTMYPAVDEIILVSNAAIKMFSSLKDDEGGIVSVIRWNIHIRII